MRFIVFFISLLLINFSDIPIIAQTVTNEVQKEQREERFSAMIDAITDSALNYLAFTDDSLSEFFPIVSMFGHWDTVGLFHNRADFSEKKDTTILILAHNSATGYCHPVPGKVNSNFGWRRKRFHYGIDLALKTGDTVKSAFDGVVRITRYHKNYGNVVIIRHFNGLETTYAHLSKISVLQNQTVNAGSKIGLGGNTGRSTGPHLHFELRYLGVPLNPSDVIDFENQVLISDTLRLTADNFRYSKLRSSRPVNPGNKSVVSNSSGSNQHTSSGTNKSYYTVRKGDTLGAIAIRNKTSVNKLCQLNGIKSTTVLRVGMKLRIR